MWTRDLVASGEKFDSSISDALVDYAIVTKAGLEDLRKSPSFRVWESTVRNGGASERAFLLGFAAHRLELDDGYRQGGIHIGAPVISALLSLDAVSNWTAFAAGLVCGYEIAGVVARSVQPEHKRRGFHATGTCGCLGAAAAVSIALGFNEKQVKRALSCAADMASGFLEMQENGSELKPLTAANAASNGVKAALFSGVDLAMPVDAIGGCRGMLACLGAKESAVRSWLPDGSFETLVIRNVYRKIYPSCRHSHSAIDAAITLSEGGRFSVGDVQSIVIETYRDAIAGHESSKVPTSSAAMMSTPFCVASALLDHGLSLCSFELVHRKRREIARLMKCTSMLVDEHLDEIAPSVRGARVTIELSNGSRVHEEVLYPRGEPENPFTESDLLGKARDLVGFPDRAVGPSEGLLEKLIGRKCEQPNGLRGYVLGEESA